MSYVETLIEGKIVNIHTAFIGKVLSVDGNIARVQPLTYSKSVNGTLMEQATVAVYIPQNVKFKQETITYMKSQYDSETKTIIVPDAVDCGDIVFCGVSERDITRENLSGKIAEPTRRHDMNDSVILAVF